MAFYIQSIHSGLFLDIKDEKLSAGGEVISYTFHGAKNQQWKYINGKIYSKLNELVLDIDKSDNRKIIMNDPSDSESQKWHFEDDLTIRNEADMVLDVAHGKKDPGTEIIGFKKHGQSNQKFRVVPINKEK